ncbi:MAG: LptA/OstA family protein [Negativicutes bacterium]
MRCKIFVITLFIALFFTSTVFAAMPVVKADKQYFDVNTGLHILSGNVSINHKDRSVTAGTAKTNMSEVWASGGISYSDKDISLNGSTVYVSFPSRTAYVDGMITFSRSSLKIIADHSEYNWKTKTAIFTGNVQVYQNQNFFKAERLIYNVKSDALIDENGSLMQASASY